MKFLFDQNISHRILQHLPSNFSGSASVKGKGLLNSSDIEIWAFAKKQSFIIVTQDSDFNDLNSLHGYPPKINDTLLEQGKKLRQGIRSTAQSEDLIVWLEPESSEKVKISFE